LTAPTRPEISPVTLEIVLGIEVIIEH